MIHQTLERYAFEGERVVRRLRVGDTEQVSGVDDRSDDGQVAQAAWWQSFLRGGAVYAAEGASKAPPIRAVDAFCGCGGLTLGAAQAAIAAGRRFESIAAIDVDDDGLQVHRANFGTEKLLHSNVSSLVDFHLSGEGASSRFTYAPEIIDGFLEAHVGKIDLFTAGPPCQGFSNLNNRTRRDDHRSLLYVTAIALGIGLRARSIVIENVPDVVADKSKVVQVGKALLKSAGYEWIDSGILAADHLGGAQTRKRHFLIASLAPASESDIHIRDIARDMKQTSHPLSWAIGDLLHEPGQPVSLSIMDTTPVLTAVNDARIAHLFENKLYDLPDKQRPDSHKNGNTYPSVYGRMYWEKPAQTITTGFLTPGRGRHIHPLRRRVITPREAARIQSFPDTFRFIVDPDSPPSRQSLQKWIGDAVPPLLGYAATLPLMLKM